MKKIKSNILLFVVTAFLAVISPAAFSQETDEKVFPAPFGLEWGMTQDQVSSLSVTLFNCVSKSDFTLCKTKSLPKNLSDADDYTLIFASGHGLVKAVYYSDSITGDVFGFKGKLRYGMLQHKLTAKYGKPELLEYSGRRLWNEPDEFYQCLRHDGCGDYMSLYETQKTRGTTGVVLELEGLKSGVGYIKISYESSGFKIALDKKDAAESEQENEAL